MDMLTTNNLIIYYARRTRIAHTPSAKTRRKTTHTLESSGHTFTQVGSQSCLTLPAETAALHAAVRHQIRNIRESPGCVSRCSHLHILQCEASVQLSSTELLSGLLERHFVSYQRRHGPVDMFTNVV